jgi:hypothetical protein
MRDSALMSEQNQNAKKGFQFGDANRNPPSLLAAATPPVADLVITGGYDYDNAARLPEN